MVFCRFFGVVNRFGEPEREKTENEGEIFRGAGSSFAFFLSIDTAEVRFYGSQDGIRRIDRPKDWSAGNAGDWKGEGIRGTG
ncbi:hypothetical protein OKW39_007357 [Paraburkholderia sp. MM6662-R1]